MKLLAIFLLSVLALTVGDTEIDMINKEQNV